MSRDLLIGVDAGTSMLKAVAFTADGAEVAVASAPNRYDLVDGGGVEQDMARTWRDLGQTLRRLGERMEGLAERTMALAITGQGDGTWLIDAAGEPIGPAWLWLDSRAAALTDRLRRDGTGARTYALTGCGLNACMQSTHLVWLKRHRPEQLARAATALHCKDWLYFKLTGVRATDPAEGTFTFGNFRECGYSAEILRLLGIPELARLLPPILDGSRTLHGLTHAGAAATGLRAGTPVALGYLDTVCTGLGGGLYDPVKPVGCTIVGTTGMHMRIAHGLDEIRLNEACTGYVKCLPVPGCWAQAQSNMAGALNIEWLLDRAAEVIGCFGPAPDRTALLATIDERIGAARPGAVLFHPFIATAGERGPFTEPSARAQFLGLTTQTGFFDLARAVYEALGFSARDCYAAIGRPPEEVRLTGGAARSANLRRIIGAALGIPVRHSRRNEAGAAGAAMMAAVGLGLYPDMPACCAEWADPLLDVPEPPDPELTARYTALFPIYQAGHEAMRELWPRLARARQEIAGHG